MTNHVTAFDAAAAKAPGEHDPRFAREAVASNAAVSGRAPVRPRLITCLGELLVDFLPVVEDNRTVGFRMYPGGSLLNVAVATARLGGQVALAGKVGTDFFGRYLHGYVERQGVDLRWLISSEARSTLAFVAIESGEPVFTLIDPKSVWVLAFIDESKAGEIAVGKPADIVLRSRPNQRFSGTVARIEPESDRVNEERRVAIAFDHLPADFHLGEQAEVYITTVQLPQALLVPEAAIVGLGKGRGYVWTVEDGRFQQHEVTLGHRLLDGRYEITGGLPDKSAVVAQLRSGIRAGRAATIAQRPGR